MAKMKEFGVMIENARASDYLAQARFAEELGFATVWLAENYYFPITGVPAGRRIYGDDPRT